MKKLLKFVFAILLLPVCANATTIDFNDHDIGTIQASDNYDQVTLHDFAIVNMLGGNVYSVFSYNSSTFNMQNGDISGWITLRDTSNLTTSGGFVEALEVYDSAVASMSGGNITRLATGPLGTGVVHIYGKNFELNFGGGWLIEGNWADETPFAIHYRSDSSTPMPGSPNSNIFLHTIPEPMTMAFLLIGISSIRKFRG